MKTRDHDPRRLDVAAFANEGASLQGAWPIADLGRLADVQATGEAPPASAVQWQAQGESVPRLGGAAEVWMSLQASLRLALQCQRCLAPVVTDVHVDRRFRFVSGEDQAAALDAEIDDEVLALNRSMDLQELVEDELLLALPLVPRHEPGCPAAPPMQFEADEVEGGDEAQDAGGDAPRNPFAALAALKKKPD